MIPDEEFERLEFNPKALYKGQLMVNKYPKLKRLKTFQDKGGKHDHEFLIRYVVFMYDPDTPLKNYFSKLDERKSYAITLAGFEESKSQTRRLDKIKNLKDDRVVDMIVEYLRSRNNLTWELLCATKEVFHENIKLILTPPDDKKVDKDALIKDNKDYIKEVIPELQNMLYGDNKDIEEKVVEIKEYTPEKMAS